MILQDAALARIAGKHDIHTAAQKGDIEHVRDLVIANPACVYIKDVGCEARPLHMLLRLPLTHAFANEGGIAVLFGTL